MRTFVTAAVAGVLISVTIWGSDWPSPGGNPQRDGWAKFEKAFTKENVGNLQLLYTYTAENGAHGLNDLTSPLVNGLLITYLGFKEMLVFGGSSDVVYSVDADLNRTIWKTQLGAKVDKPQTSDATGFCSGGMTAALVMPGSSTAAGRGFGFRRLPPGATSVAGNRTPAAPMAGGPITPGAAGTPPAQLPTAKTPADPLPFGSVPPQAQPQGSAATPVSPTMGVALNGMPTPGAPVRPPGLLATGFGRPGAFLAVSSDGNLHVLNTATGADRVPSIPFVPAGAKVTSLNVSDETVYAATSDNCGGAPNGIYAADLTNTPAKIASFVTNGGGPTGLAGSAIAKDGVVYARLPEGHGEVAGDYNDSVVALAPKTLEVKDYFTPTQLPTASKKKVPVASATPLVFEWKTKTMVLTSARDGSLYLLDAASLGGDDHHHAAFKSKQVASQDKRYAGNGFWGAFASWEDTATLTRWVYASMWGPPEGSTKFKTTNGNAPHGSVVAFTVQDQNGEPVLVPEWISPDITTPGPVVTANGLVFVLSSGETARQAKENGSPYTVAEREKLATHATLYALDGKDGKELYSSNTMARTFSHSGSLAIANRRIYFTTNDNTAFCLGFLSEQPQLTEK